MRAAASRESVAHRSVRTVFANCVCESFQTRFTTPHGSPATREMAAREELACMREWRKLFGGEAVRATEDCMLETREGMYRKLLRMRVNRFPPTLAMLGHPYFRGVTV